MFHHDDKIIGGMGTTLNNSYVGKTYARIDDPENGNPGYFTYKKYEPTIYYPDGETESAELGSYYTFLDTYPKASDTVSTVTFKYQNGEEDYVSDVLKQYEFQNWNVNGTNYYG